MADPIDTDAIRAEFFDAMDGLALVLADEIDRLRAEVRGLTIGRDEYQGMLKEALHDLGERADEIARLRAVLVALDVRPIQPHMGGGGHYSGHGPLTVEQAATVRAAVSPKDGER